MYKSIIIRELKRLKYKTIFATLSLTIVILFAINLFQLTELNIGYNLNLKNIRQVIQLLNEDAYRITEFQNKLISYSFLVPVFLYFFYIGFPNILKIYKSEKITKNMYHLLITPFSISGIIRSVSFFTTIITLVPSLIIFLIISLIFKGFGVGDLINEYYLVLSIFVSTFMIFAISFLLTSILWLTNCNNIVYMICRISIVFGMSSIYILIGQKVDFTRVLTGKAILIELVLAVIIVLISEITCKFISKEKIFLSEMP